MLMNISQETISIIKRLEADNKVYYRAYLTRDNKLRVITMQPFDEIDYDQNRFLSSEKFATEEEASRFLINFIRSFSFN